MSDKHFVIYTGKNCIWCDRAKRILQKHRIPYDEIPLNDGDDGPNQEALELLGKMNLRTIPQVFIDGEHLGGYTQLEEYLSTKKVENTKNG